jgi:hypothetical protein
MQDQDHDPLVRDDERCMSLAVFERGFDARSERLPIRLLPDVTMVKFDGHDGKPEYVIGDMATIAKTLEDNGYGPISWKTPEGIILNRASLQDPTARS